MGNENISLAISELVPKPAHELCSRELERKNWLDKIVKEYRENYTPDYSKYDSVYAEYLRAEFESHTNNLLKLYNSKGTLSSVHDILVDIRNSITDPRNLEQVIYPVDVMILIIIMARICGYVKAHEVREFYKIRNLELQLLIPGMPSPKRCPCKETINTVMRMISAEEMESLVTMYSSTVLTTLDELVTAEEQRERPKEASRHTIAFDGQEIKDSFCKGSDNRKIKCSHSVTTYDCTVKHILGYKITDAKNKERAAFLQMLPMIDVHGSLVMADALNASEIISSAILKHKADYLFNIKGNAGNKELLNHLSGIFNREHAKSNSQIEYRTYNEKGHGRIDTYEIEVLPASLLDKRISCPHNKVRSLVRYTKISQQIRKNCEAKVTSNTRYYVSSLEFNDDNVTQILYSILDYWAIEAHHAIADNERVFDQDSIQSCHKNFICTSVGANKIAQNILAWRRKEIKLRTKQTMTFKQVQNYYANQLLVLVLLDLFKFYSNDKQSN